MKVAFRESFARDLKNVKDERLLKKVRGLILAAENATSLAALPGVKKLKGGANFYRMKVGDHRIGLALESGTVVFVRCLNRKEIYRHFP